MGSRPRREPQRRAFFTEPLMAAQVKTLGSRLGLMDNIVRAIAEHHRKTVKDIDGDGEFEIEALYREIIKIRQSNSVDP